MYKKPIFFILVFALISAIFIAGFLFLRLFFYGNDIELSHILKRSTLRAEQIFEPISQLPILKRPFALDEKIFSPGGEVYMIASKYEYGFTCLDTCPVYTTVFVKNKSDSSIFGLYNTALEVDSPERGDAIYWSLDGEYLYLISYGSEPVVLYKIHVFPE